MGKAGRAACIFTPMALSIASLVCIILINLGGYSKHSDTLNDLYFFKADFTNFSSSSTSSELSTLIAAARESGEIADFYQIHLWNYCTGNETAASTSANSSAKVSWCSTRERNFWFNPVDVWNIESVINSTASSLGVSDISLSNLSGNVTALEDQVLDKSARDALKTYHKLSTWMFTAYFVALWLLLGTVIFGVLAVFSRWFGFLTWLLSVVSTVLVFGASITASIMFPILVKALNKTLGDYGIHFTTSTHTLGVTWLATAFTLLATLFWLFSACCCSGKSNPHHRSNKEAPAKEFGLFGGQNAAMSGGLGRGRSNRAEKAGGYERVESPYVGGHDSDNVPLTQVAVPPYGHHAGEANAYYQPQQQHTGAFEPYRHN